MLVSSVCVLGRQLSCTYDTSSYALWPTFNHCKLSSIDLSESYKTVDHTFTGTSEQKSVTTAIWFDSPVNINFLPKQIINNFPKFNGLIIQNCRTVTTLNDNLFTRDFKAIKYLNLYNFKIEIEANAFQHLTKLKWIVLQRNQIQSLPHQLFKNNPKIIFVSLSSNRINSITPDFFKNLNKLQYVHFGTSNECIKKDFGCSTGSCSVAQSELDSELSTCYTSCLNDVESGKSGKLDNLNLDDVENSGNLTGHVSTLIERKNTSLLTKNGDSNLITEADSKESIIEKSSKLKESAVSDASLLQAISQNSDAIKNADKKIEEISKDSKDQRATIESLGNNLTLLNQGNADKIMALEKAVKKIEENEKITENLLSVLDDRLNRTVQEVQEKSLKNTENCEKFKLELNERNDQTMKLFKENSTAELSAHLESTKEEVKDLTKVLMLQIENERLQFKLRETEYTKTLEVNEAKHALEKQTMESEMKALKQEIVELNAKLEESKESLKAEFNEILQKKFDDFVKKLMEDNRP